MPQIKTDPLLVAVAKATDPYGIDGAATAAAPPSPSEIVERLESLGVKLALDVLTGDGHDHVPILIDRKVRDRLRDRLFEPDMRGIGFTAFVERALVALAND